MPSGRFAYAIEIASARGAGQDRAAVFEPRGASDRIVLALADGAGGTGHGAAAAQAILDAVDAASAVAPDWCDLLCQLDRTPARLGHGQSTAVLVDVSPTTVSGASVGDSGAWWIHASTLLDLTEGQRRKPLVGAGCAPFRIAPTPLGPGTLLVASDGLLRYAPPRRIAELALGPDLAAAARALVDLVRLPNGSLQDDVSVILCRAATASSGSTSAS